MILVYTDGSGVNNSNSKNYRLGGIGVVFVVDGVEKLCISKGYRNTTSSRMELLATLTALETLDKKSRATIISDSEYVIKSFTEGRLKYWAANDYPCKNRDLMERLWNEFIKFPPLHLKFRHVKGHNGHKHNERADELASYKNFTEFEQDMSDSFSNEIYTNQ